MKSPRPPKPQYTLTVESTEWIGPHLVRVVLGGADLERFADTGHSDQYVKLLFVDPELGLRPPYDLEALRRELAPEHQPVRRTYTVRWLDLESRRLAIDFVTHGDEGLAGPWAQNAQPGDELTFVGPGGAYTPDPAADWHLLAGDLSALPAIAAALEALPGDARGVVHLEVDGPEDILDLTAPEGVELVWFVNASHDVGALSAAIAAGPWLEGRVHVFAHGERESIKAVRRLLKERGVPREDISISGYWARGRTEDRFQAEKREPIGKIED